ncbi:hypothetical protein XELAEV_18026918mg [Xenopus laevis]|uniref:Uncharacterized protein n=1 Tax=Xenopus laevis TaxID=8355 RepID=A0A974CVC7_XENLA|nr:hypothetical protein XELAEV_18026918mg [Xenopus laevis]
MCWLGTCYMHLLILLTLFRSVCPPLICISVAKTNPKMFFFFLTYLCLLVFIQTIHVSTLNKVSKISV